MTGFLKVSLAAALAVGSVLAAGAPALAQPGYGGGGFHGGGYYGGPYDGGRGYAGAYRGGYGGYGGYGYRGGGYGGFGAGALIGGLAGLAIGASIHPHYGYYRYGTCLAPQQVWNPYVGGYVIQQVPYPC